MFNQKHLCSSISSHCELLIEELNILSVLFLYLKPVQSVDLAITFQLILRVSLSYLSICMKKFSTSDLSEGTLSRQPYHVLSISEGFLKCVFIQKSRYVLI